MNTLSFQYVDPFTRVVPRKKRKDKARRTPSDILQGVMDELVSDSWITTCQRLC
jgi:hypothetical protein